MTNLKVKNSTHMSERLKGLFVINIAAIIFGTAALFGKLQVSPVFIVFSRAFFATVTLYCCARVRNQDVGFYTYSLIKPVIISSIFLAVHWVTFFLSVQWSGVALATLTFATFPMCTVYITSIKKRRSPHYNEIFASSLIIVAIAILFSGDSLEEGAWAGGIAGIVSALSFALFGIASKDLAREVSPLQIGPTGANGQKLPYYTLLQIPFEKRSL
jgi:drug/metabolite transporter (DMT)-like permease